MRRRGITDFSLAMVDPWSAGNFGIEDEKGRRLSRTLTWVSTSACWRTNVFDSSMNWPIAMRMDLPWLAVLGPAVRALGVPLIDRLDSSG